MTHAKVLSEQELFELPVTEHLGEGSFGTVDRVTFKGRDAIRKASKSGGDPTGFLCEARVTLEVDGMGQEARRACTLSVPNRLLPSWTTPACRCTGTSARGARGARSCVC